MVEKFWLQISIPITTCKKARDSSPRSTTPSAQILTLWDSTALLVVYDEHGGIYDHVVPPVMHSGRVFG